MRRGSRAGSLGKDGSGRSPADTLPRGERAEVERPSRHKHTQALSHTQAHSTHAWVHLHVCVCTRVCTRNDTCPAPEPGPRVQQPQQEAWARVPTLIPSQAQGEPGSAWEPCPEVRGGPVGESGGTEARLGHSAPAQAPPPPRPLPGWQHSLGAAPCSPAFPSFPPLSPERTPRLQQHPQAPAPQLSSCHNPSQPQCHLLSVSWGVICLLPHVCGRPSPAMGTPGSSVGSVTITNVGMDAEGRPGCSRKTQLEESEDGTGEGS